MTDNIEPLELWHHGSSACAAKVRVFLEEKKIKWVGHYVDILSGGQFNKEFLYLNTKAMVPVLRHEGKLITESTIICEYLEDCFPSLPLYPVDPYERVKVKYWTKIVDEEWHPACSALTYITSHRHTILRSGLGSFEEFMASGTEPSTARKLKWQWLQEGFKAPGAMERINDYLKFMDKMEVDLSKNTWLCGRQYTMADAAVTPYVNRLAVLGMHEVWENGRLPHVEKWFQRIQERPSFTAAMLSPVPDRLREELLTNGKKSWNELRLSLGI
jgi:glutathione S-transferase